MWAHSSVWIEWLPAEQLVEGSNPSGPKLITMLLFWPSEYNISIHDPNNDQYSV